MSSGFFGGGIGPTAIKRRSGLAAPVPVTGAELLTNGDMETGDPPTGWTSAYATLAQIADPRTGSAGTQAAEQTNTGANGSVYQRISALSAGNWIFLDGWIRNVDATSGYFRLLGSTLTDLAPLALISSSSWTHVLAVGRTIDNYVDVYVRSLGATGVKIRIDDVSAAKLTLSSLFSTRPYASANCDLSAAVTRTAGTQAGFVARLDSATSPANFLIAYLDGAGNVKVDKCVGGTYTNVISGAITYGSTKILRLVCSGNNVSCYYNGTQVGSTVTVSDAGIVSNTRHGLFSTYASNSFAGYVAA